MGIHRVVIATRHESAVDPDGGGESEAIMHEREPLRGLALDDQITAPVELLQDIHGNVIPWLVN